MKIAKLELKSFNFILITFLIGIISIVVVSINIEHFLRGKTSSEIISVKKDEIDFIKGIIISLFGAGLIAVVPNFFQEVKYNFEMKATAKKLYTETKTGMIYLPLVIS